jgi:hypothetical protein
MDIVGDPVAAMTAVGAGRYATFGNYLGQFLHAIASSCVVSLHLLRRCGVAEFLI